MSRCLTRPFTRALQGALTTLILIAMYSTVRGAAAEPAVPGCTVLTITPQMFSAPAIGVPSTAAVQVSVYANGGCGWTVQVPPAYSWLHVVPQQGTGSGGFSFSVDPFPVGQRSGYIHVLAGSIHRILTVNQGTAPPGTCLVTTTPTNGSSIALASTGGGSIQVTTGTTCAWTVEVTGPDSSWLQPSPASGVGPNTILLNAQANCGAQRTAGVRVHTANGLSTLTVNQAASAIAAPAVGLTVTVDSTLHSNQQTPVTTIPASCPWSAAITTVPTPNWLTLVNASSSGGNFVGWSVTANDGPSAISRSATITVTSGAATRSFIVQQTAPPCSVTTPANGLVVEQSSSVGSGSTPVTTNLTYCTWSAEFVAPAPGWLTLTQTTGTGSGSIGWRAHENTGAARSASIRVSCGATSSTFTVQQDAPPCTVIAPADGLIVPQSSTVGTGSTPVTMSQANCVWTAAFEAPIPTWIALTTSSGTGAGAVGWSVHANTGVARSAVIKMTSVLGISTFTVQQAAPPPPPECTITAPANNLLVAQPSSAGPGATPVTITTNTCEWTATFVGPAPEWLSFTTSAGTGNGSVGWIVLENTGAVRSVDINVTSTAGLTTFRVQQASPSPPVCALTQPVNGSVVDQSSSVGPGSTAVAVTDPTCAWSAAFVGTPPDWLVLTTNAGTGDGSVGWRAHQNTGPLRSTSIIVTSGSSTSTFTVRQAAPVCSISAPVDGLVVDQSSAQGIGVTPVTVSEANCAWSAEFVGVAPAWILLTTSSGTSDGEVKWSVHANTGSLRSAAIRVTSASNTTTFTVDQDGSGACSFATNPETGTTLYLDSGAPTGAIAVVVADSCAWSAASSDSTWLHVTAGSSGTGFGLVHWSVDANAFTNCVGRVASITVSDAHQITQSTLTFVQACAVSANPNSLQFVTTPTVGQTVTVAAIACPQWTASIATQPAPSWFGLVEPFSGGTGDDVHWQATANSGSTRFVNVNVAYAGGASTFTVVQSGSGAAPPCAITAPLPGTEVDSATGSLTVTLQTPCQNEWAAGISSASSWLTLGTNTGASGASITWTAQANTGSVRYAEIVVSITGSQSFFIVKQDGPVPPAAPTPCVATAPANYLVVQQTQAAGSGSTTVSLANSLCQWEARASTGWLTLSGASGTGNGEFTVNASANVGAGRSGAISIGYVPEPEGTMAVETSVAVHQAPASGLALCTNETNPASGATVGVPASPNTFELAIASLPPAGGGQCHWAVSTTESWVTLSQESGEGLGSVGCAVGANLGVPRTAIVEVYQGSQLTPVSSFTVSQAAGHPPEDCTEDGAPKFSPATTTVTLDPNGERGSIGVLAGEVCLWSATVDSPWLQCSPPTDVLGAGTISWNAQSNTTGLARHGTITVTGGLTRLILTLSQASGAADCSVQLVSANWPGPSQDNLMFSLGVSTMLQQRLTEQFGADHWDENVFVNLFSDLGASGASPRPASGWPVMSLSGHPGCQFVTASDRAGNLIPANRFATIGSNFLSASFPLSTLRYSDGGHYLVTNATATADWFPGTTTWEGLFQWCTGSPQQKCINSGQILLSLYRPLESQGGAVASCLTTNQSPNCPSPGCGSVAGMAGGLPAASFAMWCADSYQHNQNCVDVAETWWNCDQLTPQTSVEFTWPADNLANQLSGDVTYINGVGLPVDWTNWNCNGTTGSSVGQPAQNGVLGYSFEPADNPPQPHHALGTGFAQGWWSEDSFAAAPVKAFNADDWSKLTQYLTSAGTLTGTKLATLTSFPSYPPGTPPVCDVAGASGATWDYAGYGQPPHTGFCTAASQTNPCMPLEFASATTWNFTAHWVQVGDANTQPWWEPLQSLEVIGQALIPGSDPAEYFYASFIAAEETGFVVCTGTVKTSSSDFPPIGSTFYVVMPYQQNFADASQIYTPNPKYVVLWDSPNNSSVTTCVSFGGRITDTAFEASATSYWRRYWANGSDASAMASISGDLSNSIVWGVFANTTAVNATPRTINGQDWGSVYSYCPVGSSGQLVDLSMGAYYCLLANLNGTNGEIPKWIGRGLGGTIFSEFVNYWVAGSFVTGAVQPVAVGYYTSYQDRIKAGPLGQSSQNPTLNSGAEFGYIELTVMDPWDETPPPPPLPMGDADGDGCTDVEDLYYMLSVWGPVNSGHSADFNRDGMVDSRDFPSFLGGFGSGCDR